VDGVHAFGVKEGLRLMSESMALVEQPSRSRAQRLSRPTVQATRLKEPTALSKAAAWFQLAKMRLITPWLSRR
jgi:hypothetical protein